MDVEQFEKLCNELDVPYVDYLNVENENLKPYWELFSEMEGDSKCVKPVNDWNRDAWEYQLWCNNCQDETCHVVDGYNICSKCSAVHGENFDDTAEWRYYGPTERGGSDPCRVGLPNDNLIPESGIGSLIGWKYKESYNMMRVRRSHSWGMLNHRGRKLIRQFEYLQTVSRQNGLPQMIINHSKELFKHVSQQKMFRGSNKEGLIAICVYHACKDNEVPRSIKEIAAMFNINDTTMTKGNRCYSACINEYREKNKECATQLDASYTDKAIEDVRQAKNDRAALNAVRCTQTPVSKPVDYIERFCCKLSIPFNYHQYICKIAIEVGEKRLITDNTSASIAAAVIFFVSDIKKLGVTRKKLNKYTEISEVTIGKCHKKLMRFRPYLMQVVENQNTEL
jgi:transcription initiation factor TFIIB